jgi:hypothetical protein
MAFYEVLEVTGLRKQRWLSLRAALSSTPNYVEKICDL